MKTTIKNHFRELRTSTEYMLLYHSDNKMLISYLKDFQTKLIYLEELTDLEDKYNLHPIAEFITETLNIDKELTHIDISVQLKELYQEKKVAKVTAKLF